jgi:hypothetical protein
MATADVVDEISVPETISAMSLMKYCIVEYPKVSIQMR